MARGRPGDIHIAAAAAAMQAAAATVRSSQGATARAGAAGVCEAGDGVMGGAVAVDEGMAQVKEAHA